jgi:hypothetical protein
MDCGKNSPFEFEHIIPALSREKDERSKQISKRDRE